MKIQEGEVFSVETNNGFGFIQFVETDSFNLETIRVLEPLKSDNKILQEEVNLSELYTVGFAIKLALKRKLVNRVGIFEIPAQFTIPTKARSEHIVRGEFLGWHIVDVKSLQRELKKELNENDLKLSPHGYPSFPLLVERLETNWRLENWK